jgi:hypothetical protein
MKKFMIGLCMLVCVPHISNACDICGCGVGNGYIGILPDFAKRVIGIRYRFNSLQTHLGAGGSVSYLTSMEKYHTTELWMGWNLSQKVRLMASLPYNLNQRQNQGQSESKSGIGDVSLSGFYALMNKKKSLSTGQMLVQSLWLGGGIKLPAGEYADADKSTNENSANLFQLGTGSIDFSANIMYDVRLQDVGFNVSAGYKTNTANKYDYRYGNKFSLSTQAYSKVRIARKLSISPNAGIQYEGAAKDYNQRRTVDMSGGKILLATAGIEAVFSKILVGANYQLPLSQRLAEGFVKGENRWMMHVSRAF